MTHGNDLRNTKGSSKEIKEKINKKTKELESLSHNIKTFKIKMEELSSNNDSMFLTISEPQLEVESIYELQEELKKKDNEVAGLIKTLSKMGTKIPSEYYYNDESIETKEAIKKLNYKLDEIKILLSQNEINKTNIHAHSAYGNFFTQKKRAIPHKLHEISTFIETEKARLKLFNKSILRDYKVSVKLLKGLQGNVDEWNGELSQCAVTPIIGGVKNGLERQIETLHKQIGQIRYFIILMIEVK